MGKRIAMLAVVVVCAAFMAGCATGNAGKAGAVSADKAAPADTAASGATYRVSDLQTLYDLLNAKANPGDLILIEPGVYYMNAYPKMRKISVLRGGTPDRPIIVRGVVKDGKRPVIDGRGVETMRGIFYFEEGSHDVTVEDLELRHAAGAAYFKGKNITCRRIYSHHNDNGFFASHTGADYILIEDCEIAYNGVNIVEPHAPSHNFYICARHQIVRNSYIHHSREGENFKSRGDSTILAYNWIEEDAAYVAEIASGGSLNTLWIGNTIIKRSTRGHGQRRMFAVGDGSGRASGKFFMINNTLISSYSDDYYIFSHPTSTTDIVLINNVFAGPATVLFRHEGQGKISGSNNWFQKGLEVPDTITNSTIGEDPVFEDGLERYFRPAKGSALIDAGVTNPEFEILDPGTPSPEYQNALDDILKGLPTYEPGRKAPAMAKRPSDGKTDIGAYEYVGPK